MIGITFYRVCRGYANYDGTRNRNGMVTVKIIGETWRSSEKGGKIGGLGLVHVPTLSGAARRGERKSSRIRWKAGVHLHAPFSSADTFDQHGPQYFGFLRPASCSGHLQVQDKEAP